MRFWPIKIASTVFWLVVTALWFYLWLRDRSSFALGFLLFFTLLFCIRTYLLYREWRYGRQAWPASKGPTHGKS
jgi:hypothetical protein